LGRDVAEARGEDSSIAEVRLPNLLQVLAILLVIAIGSGVCVFFALGVTAVGWAIVLAALYFLAGIVYTKHLGSSFLIKVFVTAYLLRLGLAVAFALIRSRSGYIASDEAYYFDTALNILDVWRGGSYFNLKLYQIAADSPNWLYPVYVAVHFLMARSHLLPVISNCFFGALTCVVLFRASKNLFGERVAQFSAVLAVVFPNLVYYSALDLKDILIAFLLVLVFCQWQEHLRAGRPVAFVSAFLACMVLIGLRFYVGVLMLFIWAVLYLLVGKGRVVRRLIWVAIAGALVLGIACVVPSLRRTVIDLVHVGPLALISDYSSRQWAHMRESDYFLASWASGLSLRGYLGTVAHFLLTPNAFSLSGTMRVLIPGALLWYFLIVRAFHGVYMAFSSWRTGLLLVAVPVCLTILHGFLPWASSVRQQLEIVPFGIVLAGVSFVKSRSPIVTLLTLSGGVLITGYMAFLTFFR
jgi:hypothetical protein